MAAHALDEVVELDEAIALASKLTSEDDTLTLVTADHSHGFTINGYAPRQASITGLSQSTDIKGKPYRILSYATGPGRQEYPSLVKMRYAVHSAEDVAIYAKGPWSHLLAGSVEQTFLAYVVGYASCIGPFRATACNEIDNDFNSKPSWPASSARWFVRLTYSMQPSVIFTTNDTEVKKPPRQQQPYFFQQQQQRQSPRRGSRASDNQNSNISDNNNKNNNHHHHHLSNTNCNNSTTTTTTTTTTKNSSRKPNNRNIT